MENMSGDPYFHEPRAKHACEPCRKKKTKCPGEKPVCSFCRRLGQRCLYLPKDKVGTVAFKSKNDSKGRLHRLEMQVERMHDTIQALTGQTRPATARPEASAMAQSSSVGFDAHAFPHPPPEILPYFVDIYKSRIHLQPLPLFDLNFLQEHVVFFPQYLLRAFLATTLPFSDHPFYGSSKSEAMDFYIQSAREMAILRAAEGIGTVELLQALCLLTLCDIAVGKQARTVMNISIASRLAKTLKSGHPETSPNEDKSRCCWSIYILEQVFTPGPNTLQTDAYPLLNTPAPISPPKPPLPVDFQTPKPSSKQTLGGSANDQGIISYCIQLISIWGEATTYMRQIHTGQIEDAWLSTSTYHRLIAEFYRYEASMAQAHRYKTVREHLKSPTEVAQYKEYWTAWLLLQTIFHTVQALLNHPLFHIATSNKPDSTFTLRPPSFLQHVVDQALMHSGWTVRLVRMMEELGMRICDPFIGYQVVVTATVHWIFAFASDDTVAERACSDFERCRGFILGMVGEWPHFGQAINGLNYLQSLIQQNDRTTGPHGIPSFKISVLWDLLDPMSIGRSTDTPSLQPLSSIGEQIPTQYVAQLHEPSESREDNGDTNNERGFEDAMGQGAPGAPVYFHDPLMDEELLGSFDIPVSPQLHFLSFGDL